MKKTMFILLLMFLMSSCEGAKNPQKIVENQPYQTISDSTTLISQTSEITTAETSEIRKKTVTQTTAVVDREDTAECRNETKNSDEITSEFSEIQPKTESQTTVTVSENAEEKEFADPEESALTTAKILETQPKTESQTTVTVSENAKEKEAAESVTTAAQAEAEVEEIPDISQKTDYEKVLEVYNFMRENGSGTCVNYACQTYEMCQNVGLPCYIVWTENQLCGHVANTVKIGDIWYILDAQGGYFIDYNYGFTEVVDIDGNHIADGDMVSNFSYDELN